LKPVLHITYIVIAMYPMVHGGHILFRVIDYNSWGNRSEFVWIVKIL